MRHSLCFISIAAFALALALLFGGDGLCTGPRPARAEVYSTVEATAAESSSLSSEAERKTSFPSRNEASRAASILFELGDISWHRVIFPPRSPVDASAVPADWATLVAAARDGAPILEDPNGGADEVGLHHQAFHLAKRAVMSGWAVVNRARSSLLGGGGGGGQEHTKRKASATRRTPPSFDRAHALRSALALFAAATRAGPGPGAGAALFALGEVNAHAACGAGSEFEPTFPLRALSLFSPSFFFPLRESSS